MPLPNRGDKESKDEFLTRCMSDSKMNEEYPDNSQRYAVCIRQSKADLMEAAEAFYEFDKYGYTEEITEYNFYAPASEEYEEYEDEEEEDIDISEAKPGLWENIRRKKEREGKNYKPAKPGDPDRPTQEQIKKAQSEEGGMAKGQLKKIVTQASHLYNMMTPEMQLDGWVQDKLSKAEHFIEAVYDYIMFSEPEKTEAVQYGKPGKNDPRKTPAPKEDQKKGSKKNKPDSAKDDKGSITFSKETEARLSKMLKEHNESGKGSKVTMGMLKAVYRRGAGAYSTSHHPKMSRDGWAIARVKAFLYLARNQRPSNPNYKQDNDLLPKSHPRSTKAAEYQGRKVTLNKPFRTPDGPKKFAVYTKNPSGNIVIVRFGDPNMEIKRDDPERRKNFRARHNCDNPGPKHKARYWSCRNW